MALQTATNPETGERFALIDNEWVPFSKTASNPDTGEKFGLIKNQWMPLNIKAATAPAAPVKPPEPRPEDQSMLRQVADVPLKVGAGLVTGIRMVADAFGADSSVSKNLRSVEDDIAALYSAQSKKDSREIARIMKEAEDKGILDQIIAGAKAMSVAPVDIMANALGTSAPAIAAGLLTTLTGGAPIVATGLGVGTGALMGAGTIKGSIYDATKQVLSEKTKMSPEQIEAAAIKAQEYKGQNLDQILLGAGLTALSSVTGAEPVIARQLAKDIVGRMTKEEAAAAATKQLTGREATKAAIRAAAEEETKKAAERGVIKQGAITAGKEFLGEGAEGGQEQMAQNIALQRQGFDVPTMQGVVSQATLEGLAGLGMGAVGGGREAYKAKQEIAEKAAGGQDLKNLFTTYDEEKKIKAPQANAEQLALIDADTRVKQEEAPPVPPAPTETKKRRKKGEPSGTDTTAGGAGPSVDATANTTANAPAAPVDTTGDLGGAGTTVPPSGGGTVGGARVELGSLSQEAQDEINNRRDEVLNLIEDGAATRLINNKLNYLNRLEEKHGVELFKPSGDALPAKRVSVQKLIDQGKGAIATAQDTAPAAPRGTSVEDAMRLADKYEKQAEQERLRLLEESRGESLPNIKVSDAVVENYNAKREEINSASDEHKATRTQLADNLKNTMKALQEAELESERIDDQLEAAKQKGDDKAVLKLGEQANEINRRAEDLVLQVVDAEKALKEHGAVKPKLPNWNKEITPVEKEVYLDNILNNTPAEHEKAARALLEYRRQQGMESREGEGTLDRREQRLIKGYEDNRDATGKVYGFKFPAWRDLSNAAKAAYLRTVANNSGLQQDVGFAEVAQQINNEDKSISSEDKQAQNKNIQKIKDEVRQKSEKLQAYYQKLRDKQTSTSGVMPQKTDQLSNDLVKMIKDNNLKGLLDGIAKKLDDAKVSHQKIYKQIAKLISNLGLKTKIEFVDSLPGDDLAIYKADIDTIYVTPEGMTYTTILHEVVHAASVRVMNLYLTGQKKLLTEYQIKAVEQILAIMKSTRGALASRYENAYENPYEFLAYALTDKYFQIDLHAEGVEYAQDIAFGLRKDKILDRMPGKKSMWTEFKKAIAGIVGYKPGQMVSNNFMMELSAAFEDILSVPTEPIYLSDLSAKKKEPKKVPEGKKTREGGLADPELRKAYELSDAEYPPSKLAKAVKDLFTVQGWRNKATAFVDTTYEIVSRERRNDLGGKIIRNLDDAFNNVAEQLALSTGEKLQFLTHYLDQPLTDFKAAFADWMKLTGESFKEASATIHMLAEMFHEPERRKALFVQMVPLSTDKTFNVGGKMISAAERRTQILGDRTTGTPGLIDQVELTDAQKKKLWAELTNLAENHNDAYGYSPNPKIGKPKNDEQAKLLTDMNSDTYTALGINMDEVELRQKQFAAMPEKQQEAANKIFASLKNLTDATKELNQIGHYWSFPVSNITGMFDYQYYLPFKNNKDNPKKPTEKDYYTDPEAISRGVSLQEVENKTYGRFAVSINPLLQVMSDAYRSADRAGRRNLTQSVKNALPYDEKKNPNGTGVILGDVVAHIPYAERDKTDMTQFKGGANIFHYNDDGSIDVLQVGEEHILEAIRYAFKHEKPLVDLANAITGWVGAQHTRYNVNFAPKNFVTDMFTNAWNMGGGMMGPLAAPKYVGLVATRVLQNGLGKAWEIALLNEKGDESSQQRMANSAKKDPFVRDMLELIKYGGKTAYIESFSIKNNTEKLKKLEKNSWIADTKESIDNLLDTWSSMFELTSRTAAYGMFREYYYKKNLEKNMDEKSAYQAACTQAAAETKNLTNFEKVGKYGRELGALYMFIRPSAISATRAIETAAPAFTTLDVAKRHMPAAVQNDPAAVEEYIKNFKQLRTNSQIMIATLMGAGYATYWMAMMMAPDDEWKRNSVRSDNMQQWTRNARFHMPDSLGLGKDVIIQIPWGFGLGAFPAIGAQIGGMYHGQTSFKDGMGNIVGSILTDSFLPIPISKIPVSEQPLKWAFDSVVPSVLRPISEYIMNMNGIGQAINSATMRRFGDAFTGGDRIPEVYKDFTAWLYNKTQGAWDVSPNTAYFLTNSYIDGIARIGEMSYNWVDLSKGEKAFNPKTDLALLGSFFGAKSNVDAREFSSIQEKIKDLDTRLKTLNKTNRATAIEFRAEHPGVENAISVYNQQIARLDKIRKRANEIRAMEIPPIDKQELLRLNILQQNMLKHEIIERLKVYGVEP